MYWDIVLLSPALALIYRYFTTEATLMILKLRLGGFATLCAVVMAWFLVLTFTMIWMHFVLLALRSTDLYTTFKWLTP